MKHHEYQIYYGGFKIKLRGWYYCKECKSPTNHANHQYLIKQFEKYVRSHKK